MGKGPASLCLWERRGAGRLWLTPASPCPAALGDSWWSLVPREGLV